MLRLLVPAAVLAVLAGRMIAARPCLADDPHPLSRVSPRVLSEEQQAKIVGMVERDIARRRSEANAKNLAEWRAIKGKDGWERHRNERVEKLRSAIGTFSISTARLPVEVTGLVEGDGFVIENLAYQALELNWVTGNLYLPAEPVEKPPGILIVHSHHRDKFQGELQDMGMTWARAGCAVLVIDLPGYGERRGHPFHLPEDYPTDEDYPVSRQDYFHRYDSGIQLQLAGESLMGWMCNDLYHGVDLLLEHAKADPYRIIILGAVAGGGDPAGVAAALDARIDCCVPFNFGGPQPETEHPLPGDAEESFNYLMGSYWDSTRGLRRMAADGFFHWLIVGSIAPRRMIYAHEFAWDRQRDPVWKRYEKIWGEWYGTPERLDFTHGRGSVRGTGGDDTHCTNIGAYHRRRIHAAFKVWYGIDVTPEREYSHRIDAEKLRVLTPEVRAELGRFRERAALYGGLRADRARERLDKLPAEARRTHLQEVWSERLGAVRPTDLPKIASTRLDEEGMSGTAIERVLLETEPGIHVAVLLLRPAKAAPDTGWPVVVAVAQHGKQGFLEQRAEDLQALIAAGTLVCLPDVRGTGETREGDGRDRTSGDGDRSVNLLMFDQTLLGQRVRDLRSVLAYVRTRDDVRENRIALWGDSFAPANPPDTDFKVPHGVEGRPLQSEPLGGLLALLAALFDPEIHAVYIHGGLSSYASVLDHYQVLIPHDVVVPNVLTAGDLCDLAGGLAPMPLRFEALVDGRNQTLRADRLEIELEPTAAAYRKAGATGNLSYSSRLGSAAVWLLEQLETPRSE